MSREEHAESIELACLIRDMCVAKSPVELAAVFLRGAVEAYGLSVGLCYWRDAGGQVLLPLADTLHNAQTIPDMAMDEVDNPLVYSVLATQPCWIERVDALVDVGESFERLRACLPVCEAIHINPLRDVRQRPGGVLVVAGSREALKAWQASKTWQYLLQAYEQLLARLQEKSDATAGKHVEPSRETERGRVRAARLLAADFIGVSAIAKTLRNDLLRLADSSLSLLVTGETGVGKDHAAWLIHQASSREGKFVPVNCAAIPKDLIESELFGVVRGAYTGATQARDGLVAAAHGGTLFLDEIGDMPMALQGTLLRLLNEKRFRPLGATREQSSDFRLICATHRPLQELVHSGQFREDLYFRIRQQLLHLPPLRERKEDIPALVAHILMKFNREQQSNIMGLSERALKQLQGHSFPGNVRELRSLILVAAERTASGAWISSRTLAELQQPSGEQVSAEEEQGLLSELWRTDNLPEAVAMFERHLLSERLRQVQGSRRLAAESLGIPKRTLAHKCHVHRIDMEDSTT